MFEPSELRNSVYSFQKSVDSKELHEARRDQDHLREDVAVYDLARRKVSDTPYGVINRKPLPPSAFQVGLPNVDINILIDPNLSEELRKRALRELKNASMDELHQKMMSKAFELAKEAKTAEDPCALYQTAAVLFDNIMMYSRAITYYNKAVKITDPWQQVDTVLLPHTDIEKRKIERLGKVQRKRYLKAREEKRQNLIRQEEIRQEKRLQHCFCHLFRVHLILAAKEMSCDDNESSKTPSGSAASVSLFSSSLGSVSTSSRVGDRQLIEENLLKSHVNLRAAFRAFHPDRMEAYHDMLAYAHRVLMNLLPPTSPEDGIYHHSLSGSAGPLPEAHLLILHELVDKYEAQNTDYYKSLGMRYAEKCDFDNAKKYFKITRDIKDEAKTPRYDSSVPLYRHHGDIYAKQERQKELTTRKVKKNEMSQTIGSDMHRTDLLSGKRLAMVKIPLNAFGLNDEDDEERCRSMTDYTYFRGKHEGSETRVYLPPSSGWGSLPAISNSNNK